MSVFRVFALRIIGKCTCQSPSFSVRWIQMALGSNGNFSGTNRRPSDFGCKWLEGRLRLPDFNRTESTFDVYRNEFCLNRTDLYRNDRIPRLPFHFHKIAISVVLTCFALAAYTDAGLVSHNGLSYTKREPFSSNENAHPGIK